MFSLPRFLRDIIEGIYSGIPLCCIWSFAKGRHGYIAQLEYTNEDKQFLSKMGSRIQYIPCKKCMKNRQSVRIKINGSSPIMMMYIYFTDRDLHKALLKRKKYIKKCSKTVNSFDDEYSKETIMTTTYDNDDPYLLYIRQKLKLK